MCKDPENKKNGFGGKAWGTVLPERKISFVPAFFGMPSVGLNPFFRNFQLPNSTRNTKMKVWKMFFLFKRVFFEVPHYILPGCKQTHPAISKASLSNGK